MSLAAWRRCAVSLLCCVVNISVRCSSWVNVAVWAISWLESIGLLGSWYFIWATSSFRNAFWSRLCIGLAELVEVLGVPAGTPPEIGEVTTGLLGVRPAGRGGGCGPWWARLADQRGRVRSRRYRGPVRGGLGSRSAW